VLSRKCAARHTVVGVGGVRAEVLRASHLCTVNHKVCASRRKNSGASGGLARWGQAVMARWGCKPWRRKKLRHYSAERTVPRTAAGALGQAMVAQKIAPLQRGVHGSTKRWLARWGTLFRRDDPPHQNLCQLCRFCPFCLIKVID
jgi:hypothetical protein